MASLGNILVADDEPTSRLMMEAALRSAGFAVTLAADGEEVLRFFENQFCDLVMLDVDMPGRNGFEVCAALRKRVGNELPIVMVTGMDDLASIERAYESGATDFMSKPINWPLLAYRVKYLLRAHRAVLDLHKANERSGCPVRSSRRPRQGGEGGRRSATAELTPPGTRGRDECHTEAVERGGRRWPRWVTFW